MPRKVAQTWIANDELLLLLDGLDEVAANQMANCVTAINTFRQEHVIAIAVCSRSAEYKALTTPLKLVGAVAVRPLTSAQIEEYIHRAGHHVATLRHTLADNAELRDLAQTPLLLSVMLLAYHDQAMPKAIPYTTDRTVQQRLFDRYIQRMFQHRAIPPSYSTHWTLHWLHWLAKQVLLRNQTLFLIEGLQPNWLERKALFNLYRLISGLLFGLISWLLLGLFAGWFGGGLLAFFFGPLVGLLVGLDSEIKTYRNISFSWQLAISSGLPWGLFVGLLGWLIDGLSFGLLEGLSIGLIVGLFVGTKSTDAELHLQPNEGIWRSLQNGLFLTLFIGLINGLFFGLTIGLTMGLFAGVISDLYRCVQHLVLRDIFYRSGHVPRNYARFLDYAASRLFLRKVGGGYVFIHRLLLEHFAALTDEDITRIATEVKST